MTGIAIGIDLGTSGARAALVDAAGGPLATVAAPLPADRRRDPRAWWDAVSAALDGLRAAADLSAVRALAVDGTSGTVMPVAADGAPLAEASMYNDPADPTLCARVAGVAPPTSAAHGAASPLAKVLAMRGMARMLHQADWIAGQFCGRFETSDENNALKTGYDPVARVWPDWLAKLDVSPENLPTVLEPGAPIAALTAAMADRFRLPRACIVAAGTTDGCAAFLATGAHAAGDGVTSLGSTLTIKLLSDGPVFAPEFGIYSHRLAGCWLAGGASNTGGAALARHFDPATLARLSAMIDPACDSGLDYYPLPGPGERFPIADPTLAPRETPRPDDEARFLHGLLEGIARIEAQGYARLGDLGAPSLRSVRTVGGGARNAVWTALRARALGVPFAPARSEEAAVGAATLALRALTA